MHKTYHKKQRGSASSLKQIGLVLISLVLGYFCANIMDMRMFSAWLQPLHLTQQQAVPPATSLSVNAPKKPKLEFYTLLTQDDPHASANPAAVQPEAGLDKASQPSPAPMTSKIQSIPDATLATNQPVASPPESAMPTAVAVAAKLDKSTTGKGFFILQIAAFKSNAEAEKLRARLLIAGFDVKIMPSLQMNVYWYRVIAGPFSSRIDAQKTQASLLKTYRMAGMIRKADV